MLHQEMMFRFEDADLALPRASEATEPRTGAAGAPAPSKLRLAVSVAGNLLMGSALIGGMFLAPQWLAILLGIG